MVFISHANPEDNDLSMWLALQLAKEGYPVWCDLTKLLGGEDFWNDIEKAIREKTIKFLYILSKTSNKKIGPLQELQVAHNVARDNSDLKDFIIPLHIDDLPHKDINIQLSRLNAISFDTGWAKGLKTLLDKLEEDQVNKSFGFTPESVTLWWRDQFSAERGIFNERDEYLSNWFQIVNLPEQIWFHELKRSQIGKIEVPAELPFPAFQHAAYLVSFAHADDFKGKLGCFIEISDSDSFTTDDFLDQGISQLNIEKRQSRNFIARLLKLAWEQFLEKRNLPTYEMSNQAKCFYFYKNMIDKDKIDFIGAGGSKDYRYIVGYRTINKIKRYWHFGIQSKPLVYPELAYIIKPHVLFSSDGKNIWESTTRMHVARRSQCKDWWNPHWRDRILASMSWLSNEEGVIEVSLGNELFLKVSNYPILFESPVSYSDPEEAIDISEYDDMDEDEYEDTGDGDIE